MKNNAKIEDFGEKIGGARKDYALKAREYAEMFANAATLETLNQQEPLSKSVKLPELQKLYNNGVLSADAARAALVIWRSIETKPTNYRLSRWAARTQPKILAIASLLNGCEASEDVILEAEFQVLAAANWPENDFSFGSYTVEYRNSRDTFCFTKPKSGIYTAIKNGCYKATAATAEDMAQQLKKLVETDQAKKAEGPKMAMYRTRAGVIFVAPEGKPDICLHTFANGASYEERREYLNEHRAELVDRYNQIKNIPELRRDWNRPRIGQDWRNGQDITPEKFSVVLPFRGVEFGNWLNQTERAALLNSAFDGFSDLASIFGIAPESVTLGGSLAFAFASRGIPNAAAHFEPLRNVINLTKKNGAGCMAHEWFHSVDCWANKNNGATFEMATSATKSAENEVYKKGFELMKAIRRTEFFKRSKTLAQCHRKGDYWIDSAELAARGFESVVALILKANGICSDFLVNCLNMDEFSKADPLNRSEIFPYPTEEEAGQLAFYYIDFLSCAFGQKINVSENAKISIMENAEKAFESQEKADEEEKKQRAAIEEEARSHREALQAEAVAKATHAAENAKKESGAEWFEVCKDLGGRAYAIGAGCGFAFLVYGQEVRFVLLKENARIKNFRPRYSSTVVEVKNIASFHDDIAKEMANCYNAFYLTDANKLFSYFCPNTWEEFCAENAEELSKAKEAQNNPAKPTKPTDPTNGKPNSQKAATTAEIDEIEPSAAGLTLVEDGSGVYIDGDSRATYKNRKQIKAHGATWDKEAKRWTATDPADVQQLKNWFGAA